MRTCIRVFFFPPRLCFPDSVVCKSRLEGMKGPQGSKKSEEALRYRKVVMLFNKVPFGTLLTWNVMNETQIYEFCKCC